MQPQTTNCQCGNSSVGRARPCQGRGREFESRFPLKDLWKRGFFLGAGCQLPTIKQNDLCVARMVELVDTQDLKSCGHCGRAGSSPAPGT